MPVTVRIDKEIQPLTSPIVFLALRDDLFLPVRAGQFIEIDPDSGLDQHGRPPNYGYLAGLLADNAIIPVSSSDRHRLRPPPAGRPFLRSA